MGRRWTLIAALLALAASGALRAAEAERPGYLVVAPRQALPVLEPLLALRRQQCDVAVQTVEGLAAAGEVTPARLKAAIRARHERRPLRFVLLVGDARPGPDGWPAIPTHPQGFDPWLAVLGTGEPEARPVTLHRPAFAVGRLPAADDDELRVMVAKTVAYETKREPGPWQQQVHVVAGTANFGPVADALVDRAVMAVLDGAVPPAYAIGVTRGLTSSPYCYPPDAFEAKVAELFSGGAYLVAYVGHGKPRSAYRVRGFMEGTTLDCGTMRRLRCPEGRLPVAVMIACSMGRFDGERDCVAEAALETPGGPVACVASTRRNHVYGNAVFGLELTRALFDERVATLGECVLRAQTRLVEAGGGPDVIRALIDALALADPKGRIPRGQHAALLAQHVYLYGLLGDPALRLARPSARIADLEAAPRREGWTVSGGVPGMARGTAVVTLEIPRARLPGPFEPVSPEDPQWREAMKRNYARANDKVLAKARTAVRDGRFRVVVPVPEPWQPDPAGHLIKAIATDERTTAVGAVLAPPGAGAPAQPKQGETP